MKKIIIIAGATAVGKTELCIKIAQHFGLEIVSADSRQFYKEMSIGTAKPTPEEMQNIPHHFVDFLSIHQSYNVGQYENDALLRIEQLFEKQEAIILTGGSGLYIHALCHGIDEMPTISEDVRLQVAQDYQKNGLSFLLEELKSNDWEYYQTVDKANHTRIMRALEVCRTTGKPFSSFRNRVPKTRNFTTLNLMLDRPRAELYERINQRVDMMMQKGLLQEVEQLLPFESLNALQTVGYRELFAYFHQKNSLVEAVESIKQHTRNYAKRQLTWFRNQGNFSWLHPQEERLILQKIEAFLQPLNK